MIRIFIISFLATLFTSIAFKAPYKAILSTAFLGGFGSVIFTLVSKAITYQMMSYFIATFFITVCSEFLARLKKMPITVFTVPAIFPILPGVKIYTAVAYLFLKTGESSEAVIEALLAVLGMAMAMVLSSLLTKTINKTITFILLKANTSTK